MNYQNKILDLIYGRLSENEAQLLEQEIKSNPELTKIYNEELEVYQFERLLRDKHTYNKLKEYSKEKKRKRNIVYSGIAILIIVLLSLLYTCSQSNEDIPIAKGYFQKSYLPSQTLGMGSSNINEGEQFYQEGKYDKAIGYFKNELKQNPELAYFTIIIGDSHFLKEEFEEALTSYNKGKISDYFPPKNLDELNYHIALTHIALGETNSAKNILNNLIENSEELYKKKAKETLSKINSPCFRITHIW